MARRYTAVFEDIAVTAVQDFFEIAAPATGIVKVIKWSIFQTSDVGDTEEEILAIETVRGDGTVTSGSGGASVTPEPIDNGDGAAGSTVERNNTTRMVVGTGTLDVLEKYGWNVRVPIDIVYTPEEQPVISPSDRWTLSLNDTPGDSLTVSGMIVFEEIGG